MTNKHQLKSKTGFSFSLPGSLKISTINEFLINNLAAVVGHTEVSIQTHKSRFVVGNMTRAFTILFLLISLTSCKNTKSDKAIEFQYSAYSFHPNYEKEAYEFYLAYYLKVDKKGNFKLSRHAAFMDNPQYFEGVIDNEFKHTLDSIIVQINDSMPIIISDTPLILYDGFKYCLDYEIDKNNNQKIQYIENKGKCPESLLWLTRLIDAWILNTKKTEIDSFSLNSYIDTLKKISAFDKAIAPKKVTPPQDNQIKFVVPK